MCHLSFLPPSDRPIASRGSVEDCRNELERLPWGTRRICKVKATFHVVGKLNLEAIEKCRDVVRRNHLLVSGAWALYPDERLLLEIGIHEPKSQELQV